MLAATWERGARRRRATSKRAARSSSSCSRATPSSRAAARPRAARRATPRESASGASWVPGARGRRGRVGRARLPGAASSGARMRAARSGGQPRSTSDEQLVQVHVVVAGEPGRERRREPGRVQLRQAPGGECGGVGGAPAGHVDVGDATTSVLTPTAVGMRWFVGSARPGGVDELAAIARGVGAEREELEAVVARGEGASAAGGHPQRAPGPEFDDVAVDQGAAASATTT